MSEPKHYQCGNKNCIAATIARHDRMLEFVKSIADSYSNLNSVQENAAAFEAKELLNEIGEHD